MATTEEIIGPTPNGGDRSVAYFMDSEGKPADKSVATAAEIVEYKGDEVVFRTYGTLGGE